MKTMFITQATGKYFKYWVQLQQSVLECLGDSEELTFVLLTDEHRPAELERCRPELASLHVFPVDHESWPHSTLNRYQNYLAVARQLDLRDTNVIHLDADMRVVSEDLTDLQVSLETYPVVVVKHPGYFRPVALLERIKLFLDFRFLVSDWSRYRRIGGIGDWETNPRSVAFVERGKRNQYVCGGVWASRGSFFQEFVSNIVDLIQRDEQRGEMAIWHDESYLNAWVSHNSGSIGLVDPDYCYAENYPNLAWLGPPKIVAIDKGSSWRR